jgi:hypothetical protein
MNMTFSIPRVGASLVLLWLSACYVAPSPKGVAMNPTGADYLPKHRVALPSLGEATVTDQTPGALRQGGYALIGWVFRSVESSGGEPEVANLVARARAAGADFIRLRPVRSETRQGYEELRLCRVDIRGRPLEEHCAAKGLPPFCDVPPKECIHFGPVRKPKEVEGRLLSASVWKHWPELAQRQEADRADPRRQKFDPRRHDYVADLHACVAGGHAAACFRADDAASSERVCSAVTHDPIGDCALVSGLRRDGEARATEDCEAGVEVACGEVAP